ncbi:MAG: oligosaccharide flippase family protein [Bacteroidota bacterium]|nr:oligosaccharide flippase family protein [Bacteroidota bacterium]
MFEHVRNAIPSTARESGIVFAGDVLAKFLTFLITLLLLKLVTPAEYALYGVFITVLATVNQFTDSGLHASFIRFFALYEKTDKHRAWAHLRFAWRVKIIAIVGTGILLFCTAPILAVHVFRMPALAFPFRLLSVGVVGSGIFEFSQAVFQARQEFARLTALRVMESFGKIGVIVAGILGGMFSLNLVYSAYVTVPFVVGLAGAVSIRKEPDFASYGWKEIGREVVTFGRWMMLTSFSTMFLMRIDMFMLPPLLSNQPDEIGHYAAAVRLCTPLIVLTGSVSTVFFPKAMALRCLDDMRHYVRRTLQVTLPLIGLSMIYGAVIVLMIPSMFPNYTPSIPLFSILFIGYAWTIFGNPLTTLVLSIGRASAAAMISFVQLCLTVFSHYLFIRWLGALGAALSTVLIWSIAGTVSLLYLYRHRHEIENITIPGK